jgi:uncharacterized protein
MLTTLENWVTAWRRRRWWPMNDLALFRDRLPFVVITGGSAGIGRELAERFAGSGHALFLIARNAQALERVRDDLMARYRVAVAVLAVDLTEATASARIEAEVTAQGGYVDILINNAGIGVNGPFAEHDPAELLHLCDLNMRAPTELIRRFLPGMLARGRGGILNIGSLGGLVPGPHQAAYYASKAYLQSLTEAIAQETAGQGVRVSIVVPGPVATDFHRRMGAQDAFYLRLLPVMSAAHVARASHFWFRLGRTTIVPGLLHHVSIIALRFIPHSVILPILAWILRKRTPHNHV